MPEISGMDIGDVITQVKRAIRGAIEDEAGGVGVEKLELTLKAYAEKETGASLKVKVPVVDAELGAGVELTSQETQTIQLTLTPIDDVRLFGPDQIEGNLVSAIESIREAVRVAVTGPPRFAFRGAVVELNFIATRQGGISLVAKGRLQSGTTHGVKLFLTPK